MKNAFRIGNVLCILLVLGVFVGCGDDDPVAVNPPQVEVNEAGSIGVYADVDGRFSHLMDTGGTVTFHVVHKVQDGATASAFRIEEPAGWIRVSANTEFPVSIGNIDDGISIGYGQCMSGSIHVMTLTYQSPGNTEPGASFKVLPHDEWPNAIQVVNCGSQLLEDGVGKESPVNLSNTEQPSDQERPRVRME
jgi:hypothetical protein